MVGMREDDRGGRRATKGHFYSRGLEGDRPPDGSREVHRLRHPAEDEKFGFRHAHLVRMRHMRQGGEGGPECMP